MKLNLEVITESYETMIDEEVCEYARMGDTKALEYMIDKYRNLVRSKARTYFLIGADREDIIQEGMIGLYKAIRDFREDKLSSFRAFAELCITRQIITAIKASTRQKHIPLNSYVSLNKPMFDEESDKTLIDMITVNSRNDPEEMMISREDFLTIEENMPKVLSRLEWAVLSLFLRGRTYIEIADELHRDIKSIDNALQRIKKKLEKFFHDREKAC